MKKKTLLLISIFVLSSFMAGPLSGQGSGDNGGDSAPSVSPLTTRLFNAIIDGKLSEVKAAVQAGANVNAVNGRGIPPLVTAAAEFESRLEIIRFLLLKGAKPNATDLNGNSALLNATYRNHVKAALLLLQYKADPRKGNREGKAPLIGAVLGGNPGVVNALLDAGAKPNYRVTWTPESLEINLSLLQLALIRAGRSRWHEGDDRFRYIKIAENLLRRGSEFLKPDSRGLTTLWYSAFGGSTVITKAYFKKAGATIKKPHLNEALFQAISQDHPNVAKLLLAAGADINHKNERGYRPLSMAVLKGNVKLTKWMLENGADPKLVDGDGQTPLNLARQMMNMRGGEQVAWYRQVIVLLKKYGAVK